MAIQRHRLAAIFAGLHLAFCALFFALYFSSNDPQRGMAFIFFIFIDPWFLIFEKLMEILFETPSELLMAGSLITLGTVQWWWIGRLIAKCVQLLRR